MRQNCRGSSFYNSPHSSVTTLCEICAQATAVFHFQCTYPHLLLCRSCLNDFEADIAAAQDREQARYKETYYWRQR